MKLFLLFLLVACAEIERPRSYLVHEDNQTCEGSFLEFSEQVRIMKEAAGNYGYNCEAMPVPMSDGESYYRLYCDSAAGRLPAKEGVVEEKDTCKLALEKLRKDPHFGITRETMQAMEATWWMVDFGDKSCVLLGPVTIEEVVVQLESKTKKLCKVGQLDESLPELRTIVCGEKAFVITGSEEMCQSVLQAEKAPSGPVI